MGDRNKYQTEYTDVRSLVLSRDDNKCVKCDTGIKLEVHHVNGYKDNNIKNLQTLCYRCHIVAPMGGEYWKWVDSGLDGLQMTAMAVGNNVRYCTDKNDKQIDRLIKNTIIEFDKNKSSIRMKAARDRIRRETGKCEGRKAYGEITREIAGLDRIKKLARKPRDAKRRSCGVIAQLLNVEGVPSRTGKPWNRGTVWTVCKRNGWR
jgi:hypothetical protein